MPFAVRDTNAAPFVRLIVGERLLSPDEMMWLKDIKITHNKKKADTCEITFYNPSLVYGDLKIFDYARRVIILGGWNDEVSIKGPYKIEDMKFVFPPDGDPNFTLICKDPSASVMEAQVKSKKIVKKLLELVREVALEYNLIPDMQISPEEDVLIETVQRGESDAMLLQRLSIDHGYVWHVRGNTLYWVRPESGGRVTYTLNYRTGDFSLKEFTPELKARGPGGKKKQPKQKVFACQNPLSPEQTEVLELFNQSQKGDQNASQRLMNKFMGERMDKEGGTPWGQLDAGSILEGIKKGVTGDKSLSDGAPSFFGTARESGQSGVIEEFKAKVEQGVRDRVPNAPSASPIEGGVWGYTFVNGEAERQFTQILGPWQTNDPQANPSEVVRGNAASATPNNLAKAANRLKQETKLVPIEATMVPTVPSWTWVAQETVKVVNVSERLSGLYDVTEVELGYSKEEGLTTTLKGVKRSVSANPTNADSRKPAANETEQPQSTQQAADNPARPANAVAREQRGWFYTNGETGDRVLTDIPGPTQSGWDVIKNLNPR